jgi:hypothetical protein
MKRITLLKTILAASFALAALMGMAGCINVHENDHHDPNWHQDDQHYDH